MEDAADLVCSPVQQGEHDFRKHISCLHQCIICNFEHYLCPNTARAVHDSFAVNEASEHVSAGRAVGLLNVPKMLKGVMSRSLQGVCLWAY